MRKYVSIVMMMTLLFCMMAIPIQASGENENITSIKSGEAVFGSPAFKNPEDYSITVSGDGKMIITLTTDQGVYIEVSDSNGKMIAPTEYYEKTKEQFSCVGNDVGGYYLTYGKNSKTTVAEGDFIYHVQKGDYYIKLKSYFQTLCSVQMFISAPTTITATPTAASVQVNGKSISFDAYTIEGSNYFKLRDLAYALNGTATRFEVSWNGEKNAISLTSGKEYTVMGGEMAGKGTGNKTPTPTSAKIYLDGKEVQFTAYTIDGNNYFKLRDIGKAIDFWVDWDSMNSIIVIDTTIVSNGLIYDKDGNITGGIKWDTSNPGLGGSGEDNAPVE